MSALVDMVRGAYEESVEAWRDARDAERAQASTTTPTPPAPEPKKAGQAETIDEKVAEALTRLKGRSMSLTTPVPPTLPLISDVIDLGTLILLYARWGCFKSFLGIDWGLHIATGTPWNGHAVQRRPFVVLGFEAPLSLLRRAKAWCQHHDVDPASLDGWFFLDRQPRPLTDPIERQALKVFLDEIDAGLVMVDTIARTSVGVKTNTDEMMVVFDAMIDLIGPHRSVLGIGHAGKDTSKGMRGFSGQEDSADTVFQLDRKRNTGGPIGPATLTNPKQKDRDTLAPMTFDLEPVTVDAVSSAVLVPSRPVGSSATPTPARAATPVEKAITLVMAQLSVAGGDYVAIPTLAARCRRTGPKHVPNVTRADVAEAIEQLVDLGGVERNTDHEVRLTEGMEP